MKQRKRLTLEQRKDILGLTGGHCAYCGCQITPKTMHVDHIDAIYRGGADDIENMLPSCRSCNHYKHTLSLEEYREYLAGILDRLNRDSVTYRHAVRYGLVEPKPHKVVFYFEKVRGDR